MDPRVALVPWAAAGSLIALFFLSLVGNGTLGNGIPLGFLLALAIALAGILGVSAYRLASRRTKSKEPSRVGH